MHSSTIHTASHPSPRATGHRSRFRGVGIIVRADDTPAHVLPEGSGSRQRHPAPHRRLNGPSEFHHRKLLMEQRELALDGVGTHGIAGGQQEPVIPRGRMLAPSLAQKGRAPKDPPYLV